MHCLTLSILSHLYQVRHFEIRSSSWCRSNEEGLVHLLGVLGELVSIGVHTHGLHSQSVGRLGHSAGDFTAISDQQFLEHLLWCSCLFLSINDFVKTFCYNDSVINFLCQKDHGIYQIYRFIVYKLSQSRGF